MLTDSEKTDIFRHMGYEVQGLPMFSAQGGSLAYGNMGQRYFGDYGTLTYRLNLLKPLEEAKLGGRCFGSIQFSGLAPLPGDQFSVVMTAPGILANPVTSSVVVPQFSPTQTPWGLRECAAQLSTNFSTNPYFNGAGFMSRADYGIGPLSQTEVPVPLCSISAPANCNQFSLAASWEGSTAPQVADNGNRVSPYMAVAGQTLFGYIPILNFLEGAMLGSYSNMAVASTGTTVMRLSEYDDRGQMLADYRNQMAKFLGIPRGVGNNADRQCGGFWDERW